jgi:hypothetical protein
MVASKVEGVDAVVRAMNDMGDQFARLDTDKLVRRAGWMAGATAKAMCPPGKKSRTLAPRNNVPVKKDISERTDTVRYATHFVIFRRQNKKPFYVPVTLNPNARISDSGISPEKGSEDYAKFDSNRKRRSKFKPMTVFDYQQTRKSTGPDSKGRRYLFDKPSEIAAMRKIGRRGLAGEAWAHLGNKTGGGKLQSLKVRGETSVTKKNKQPTEEHVRKWTDFRHNKSVGESNIMMNNKLTYLRKKYGAIEPAIYAKTAHNLNRMTEELLKKRADRAQARMDRAA